MCADGSSGGNGGATNDPWGGMRASTVGYGAGDKWAGLRSVDEVNSSAYDGQPSYNDGGGGYSANYGTAPAYKSRPTTPVVNTPQQVVQPQPVAPAPAPVVQTPAPVQPAPAPVIPTAPVDTFDADLEAAFGRGIDSAENYFRGRGVNDVSQYLDEITAEAENRRSGVKRGATDLDSFFTDLGSDVYGDLTNQLRTSSLDKLNQIAPTGFQNTRIADTADDSLIELIVNEQASPIQDYLNRLFTRGTITETGLDSGLGELSKQFDAGFNNLNTIGSGFLNTGRSGAVDLANSARTAASNADLATGFDTNASKTSLDNYFNDFFGGLEGQLRGAAPDNMFDTSQLSAFAGALGTGNAPIFSPPEGGFEDDEEQPDDDNKERTAF